MKQEAATPHWVVGRDAYAVVYNILAPGVVIDVNCDTTQSGDFGGELVEAGVVLPVSECVLAMRLGKHMMDKVILAISR